MISFEDALQQVIAVAKTCGTQTIALEDAANSTLSAPITARVNQPPFAASAMDGYAVISHHTQQDTPNQVIGESQAGTGFSGDMTTGQSVRIFTGAPVPQGADAVIMQEYALRDGDTVRFTKLATKGQNVRVKGQDFNAGDLLLDKGQSLPPAALALVAAANVAEVEVFKKPNIGVLTTGSELVKPGSHLQDGQIVGSNIYALKPLFTPLVDRFLDFGSASDDAASLKADLKAAIDSPADIIVTTGGASVGDYDLVLPALKELGANIVFWKIAMRPGKPVILATLGNKLIISLPGNPVSAFVTAVTLVLPALRAMNGMAIPIKPAWNLPLLGALPANGPRRHFMRGIIDTLNGQTCVRPILQTDSAHLSSLALANILLVRPENDEPKQAGDLIQVLPLPNIG